MALLQAATACAQRKAVDGLPHKNMSKNGL
jgi:hypothetical protein